MYAVRSAVLPLPVLLLSLAPVLWLAPGCSPGEPGGGPEEPPPSSGAAAGAGRDTPGASSWWTDVTGEVGIAFRHETGAAGEFHLPEIMGSGAAWLDADGDGDLDAYLVSGHADPTGGGRPGPEPAVNRFFRQGPDGRFRDDTEASGLGDPGYGMGVAAGDVDGDGDVDLYVANLGPDRLYRNRGDGTFEEVSEEAGVAVAGWSSSALFTDYDRDGDLDLYVTRYVAYDPAVPCRDRAGRREYCGPTAFPGVSDVLLVNDGSGRFTDAAERLGLTAIAHAGLGVVAGDFDGDGWPDLYVANDADPNELWMGRPGGQLEEWATLLGAGVNGRGQPEAGMGVVAADLDGDLDQDLFLTHLADESNTFYRSDPGSGFTDATMAAGLEVASLPWTGFGTAAFDADLDGFLDLVVVNGRVVRGRLPEGAADDGRPPAPWDAYAEPGLFFTGGPGGEFTLREAEAGPLGRPQVGRGLAAGDFDGDGDLDLLVNHGQGEARVYRNDAPRHGRYLIVEPWDPRLGRIAVGARLVAEAPGGAGDAPRRWLRVADGGGGYQSANDPRAHFGVGDAATVDLTVTWPDGLVERFPGIATGRAIRLVRGEAEAVAR
jgi:enediyne biosynthesis protein E4